MFCNGMVTLLELAAAPGCDVLLTGGTPQRGNHEPRLEIYSPRMEQRLLGVSYSVGSGVLNVTAPPNGNIAPPGCYMLFLLNNARALGCQVRETLALRPEPGAYNNYQPRNVRHDQRGWLRLVLGNPQRSNLDRVGDSFPWGERVDLIHLVPQRRDRSSGGVLQIGAPGTRRR